MIFQSGSELIVITRGPGSIHLLNWQSNGRLTNNVASIPTSNSGITRYIIGFSHTYERFSFYWDGQGEAVYQIGNRLERTPVGRSWQSSSTVNWGASEITTTNVAGLVEAVGSWRTTPTAFIIPDNI
ncbi:hypothetical protein AX16_002515 [Volvariella volvacea WC 439]|nr:hypothetical protein AX16_002515 [Volvariella volvacea WC 439]